jgi:sulfite reductase (NADPH) hemoprotein beta-component
MSGCMNGCGHHHVGHIGILGVDKHGEEWYQITIGGSARESSTLGQVIGPSVPQAEVSDTVQRILDVYRELRHADERFIDTVRRVTPTPFKERVYGKALAAA